MAETHQLPGTDVEVKIANAVAVGFLTLTVVYIPFAWYRMNRELRDLGRARGWDLGDSPGTSTAAMFPGFLILVPPFVTSWTTFERIKHAQLYTGRKDYAEGWLGLVTYIFLFPLTMGMAQDQLNKVWQNLGIGPGGQQAGLPPGGYAAPPPVQGAPGAPEAPGSQPQYAPPPPGHRPPEAPPPPPPPSA